MSNAEWNTLSFPKLNIEFPVYSTAFTIFGFEIKWYGLLIGLGLLLALIYCFKRMKSVGIEDGRATDVVFFAFLGGLVGARMYYVIMEWEQFKGDFKAIISVRDGGLAIYGGLIGALLVGMLVAKIRKVKFPPLLDLVGLGFLIGQATGRWGNFFNHEAFGSNTDLPWGMTSPRIQYALKLSSDRAYELNGIVLDPSQPVHPCFLYESLWCIAGFVLLHLYFKYRKFDGEVFLMYAGWYGLGRFFIEGLRTDSLMVGHIRISQLVALLSVVAAVVVILAMRAKIKHDGEYVFYKDTEESKQLIAQAEEAEAAAEKERQEKKAARLKARNGELSSEDRIIDEEHDSSDALKNDTEVNENGTDN
ncbi:MAG: prolipoprotein diacylglyceryl transferase [Oscillospiraceae bacterium]|nr:prolipoprotein diacylglyceryl transferase [Oscillospiraceae bacterium]